MYLLLSVTLTTICH